MRTLLIQHDPETRSSTRLSFFTRNSGWVPWRVKNSDLVARWHLEPFERVHIVFTTDLFLRLVFLCGFLPNFNSYFGGTRWFQRPRSDQNSRILNIRLICRCNKIELLPKKFEVVGCILHKYGQSGRPLKRSLFNDESQHVTWSR